MKDGCYISVICQSDEGTDVNYISLCTALPGIDVVDGLPGNEILILIESDSKPTYSLNQVREALKRSARIDMFDLETSPESGEQYRNWYYLPRRRIRRRKG